MIDLIYSILLIVCLSSGFYFGFKIGKTSEMPKISKNIVHPIKTIKEQKELEKKDSELSKALNNLDNYDGTSLSQEDF